MTVERFKFPNEIAPDSDLNYTSKKVAAIMYRYRNCLGAYRKSLKGIANAGRLSVPTVRKALKLLERKGYVSHKRNYIYSKELKRVVYDQTTYHCSLDFSKGFTMVPCELLDFDLTPAQFTASLFIYQQMGNTNRAWPKINDIAETLHMGRVTVCRALSAIRSLGVFLVRHCIKRNGAYTSNSYHRLFRTRTANACHNAAKSQPRRDWSKPPQKTGFLARAVSFILSIGTKVKKRIRSILASHSSPYTSFHCDTDKAHNALCEDPAPPGRSDAAYGAVRSISPPRHVFAPFGGDGSTSPGS